jgi:hypothetical protein
MYVTAVSSPNENEANTTEKSFNHQLLEELCIITALPEQRVARISVMKTADDNVFGYRILREN